MFNRKKDSAFKRYVELDPEGTRAVNHFFLDPKDADRHPGRIIPSEAGEKGDAYVDGIFIRPKAVLVESVPPPYQELRARDFKEDERRNH